MVVEVGEFSGKFREEWTIPECLLDSAAWRQAILSAR